MALPTIALNSTGSDTAASGAGPSTALSGTAASIASSTTVTLLTDNPDLSGVATDGSAVIWVGSSTGRQFAKITAVNNTAGVKTVTVSDAYGATESGKNWGIGGKRATLAGSIKLGLDCRAGWIIDVQTDQTQTANFNLAPNSVAGTVTTFTSTTTIRPIITTSTNSIYGLDIKGANNLVVSHLNFKSTAGTPGNGIGMSTFGSAASYVIVSDCVIEGFNTGVIDHDDGGNTDVFSLVVDRTEIKNCVTGINFWAGAELDSCYVHHCSTLGGRLGGTRARSVNVIGCIVDSNGTLASGSSTGFRFYSTAQTSILVDHCVFSNTLASGSASPGIAFSLNSGTNVVLKNSIIYGNGQYGINVEDLSSLAGLVMTNNAFGGNGTANINAGSSGLTTGTNPITLTASPFTSSTDFALNTTAGGGPLCKAAGTTIPNASATATAPDVGAVQSGSGAAGTPTRARVFTGM